MGVLALLALVVTLCFIQKLMKKIAVIRSIQKGKHGIAISHVEMSTVLFNVFFLEFQLIIIE
jgi:hypothetical protein